MTFLHAALLGLVEGLTEYLPVSSTFHLIWTSRLLRLPETPFQKMFEVFIQSGAILAVLVLYFRTITRDRNLLKKILVSFIPTALVGLVLYKLIKNVFFSAYFTQIGIFMAVGLVFILAEKLWRQDRFVRSTADISYKEALLIGLVQALAVFPGVSRAGAVLLTFLFLRVRRDEAAKYSFLLAVPTLLSASVLDFIQSRSVAFPPNGSLLLLTGFAVAFISALVVIRWFVRFLQNNQLTPFGWYRLALGLLLVLILL